MILIGLKILLLPITFPVISLAVLGVALCDGFIGALFSVIAASFRPVCEISSFPL